MGDAEVEPYLSLVRSLAWLLRRRVPASVEYDDLEQDGMLGLVHALRTFEPEQGVPFKNYAARRIKGAMLDGLRAADPLSRDDRAGVRKVTRAANILRHQGLPASLSLLARESGLSLQECAEYLAVSVAAEPDFISGFAQADDKDEDVEYRDPAYLACTEYAPDAIAEDRQRLEEVQRCVDSMPEDLKFVLQCVCDGVRFTEAAKTLGVTPARVTQLFNQAVAAIAGPVPKAPRKVAQHPPAEPLAQPEMTILQEFEAYFNGLKPLGDSHG